MGNSFEIKKFILENSTLFWWIKPEEKTNISINALVEASGSKMPPCSAQLNDFVLYLIGVKLC